VQVGEDLRTYIEMAVALGLGPCRRFVCASMEIAAGKFERSDRAGEFWKRREGFGANLARRLMVHSCGRNWRGARREPRGDARAPPWPGKRSDQCGRPRSKWF
jgi:hypothetical protein